MTLTDRETRERRRVERMERNARLRADAKAERLELARKMAELYDAGWSLREIGDLHNMNFSTVRGYVNRATNLRKHGRPFANSKE